ncbi:Chaperone DnaJ-domain superfamily protein [Striga hermonthica]|uniref:Chaperone DnaJ-domain superfamily protein n=1 Tax=Striga hermonthica TaxID=68872 RepID=A0A9N7RQP9_STRHE|nr:Chaperone DnaJ-domain superfamily protein [Striga hermonthica]
MNKDESGEGRSDDNLWPHQNRGYREKEEEMRLWGILIFGLIGATVTTFAVTQLRSTVDWISLQLSRTQSTWKSRSSFRTSFQEEAWRRYHRRMREEHEAEMERVERIRRMQKVFDRERNKFKRRQDNWQHPDPGSYHQHFQRNDWYWKEDASFRDQDGNCRETNWSSTARTPLSHHYSVLGLDRHRTKPYSDDEIKSAFRAKAKEFHPDQNQDNKEYAEAKFKEVMVSYEAIKLERKNNKPQ